MCKEGCGCFTNKCELVFIKFLRYQQQVCRDSARIPDKRDEIERLLRNLSIR